MECTTESSEKLTQSSTPALCGKPNYSAISSNLAKLEDISALNLLEQTNNAKLPALSESFDKSEGCDNAEGSVGREHSSKTPLLNSETLVSSVNLDDIICAGTDQAAVDSEHIIYKAKNFNAVDSDSAAVTNVYEVSDTNNSALQHSVVRQINDDSAVIERASESCKDDNGSPNRLEGQQQVETEQSTLRLTSDVENNDLKKKQKKKKTLIEDSQMSEKRRSARV